MYCIAVRGSCLAPNFGTFFSMIILFIRKNKKKIKVLLKRFKILSSWAMTKSVILNLLVAGCESAD